MSLACMATWYISLTSLSILGKATRMTPETGKERETERWHVRTYIFYQKKNKCQDRELTV